MSSQLRAAETTVSGARRRQTAPVPVKAVARWMPPAHSLASHATRQPTSSRARATVSGLRHFRRREPRHCRRKPRLLHLPACRREPHLCHHHLPVCRLDPHLHHQLHLTPRPLLFRPYHLNLPRRHLPCRNLVGRPLICRPLHLGSRRRRCRQRRWGATRLPHHRRRRRRCHRHPRLFHQLRLLRHPLDLQPPRHLLRLRRRLLHRRKTNARTRNSIRCSSTSATTASRS